jgi:1,4-alpha-glucan branching enzyme
LGYNSIQLMGIMQHPYYASFGYHVSSFFAASSFFGSPEDLKSLIDTAHGMGIMVFIDLVHSHTVKNINEGLNQFDGTDYQYFHEGERGNHEAWDSKLFNYNKTEVLRFLLSNVRFWMEEYRFDGFRFDGITSMLYKNHGLGQDFDNYDCYFGDNVDDEAILYLQLANHLIKQINPKAISIAEDMSGMPGIARPISEGGIGFDYRLAMGIPDQWIKMLKEKTDDQWQMEDLFNTLNNRRRDERHIAYCESHDQALVGDKTIAFRLMDAEMYRAMSKDIPSQIIDRGIALHKMIRLITYALGGEAWLNFMGNEFAHPEWIDFPREGNNDSYQHARRQWSLVDNTLLKYELLNNFDIAMHKLEDEFKLLSDPLIEFIHAHEENKLLVFKRGPLVFIFNFHHSNSYTDYRIAISDANDYKIILTSDSPEYGGFDNIKESQKYPLQDIAQDNYIQSIQAYLPCRTVQVLAPVK